MKEKGFKEFFCLEFARISRKKNIIIIILFFLISLYLLDEGISEYKCMNQEKSSFQEIEKNKVPLFQNYNQYGMFGFRVLFLPSPFSVFFHNSGTFKELNANVETSERLRIYNTYKSKNLFSEKLGSFTDFAGIVLLIGLFLTLLYGNDTFRNKEYIKFIATISTRKKEFWYVLISRIILFDLCFLILAWISFIYVTINGVDVFNVFFLWLVLVIVLMIDFFLILAAAVSVLACNKSSQFISLAVIYFVFVFLIPWTVNKIISSKADNLTSLYHHEMAKLRTITGFEKRAFESQGKHTKEKGKTKAGRELVESFWDREFKEIQEIEMSMRDEMTDFIRSFQWLYLVFPTTFYQSVCNEESSRGYNGFIAYYKYVQDISIRFMRFYIDKKFYSDSERVESFIKDGEENVFKSRSSLPDYFGLGIILNCFYAAVLVFISYIGFQRKIKGKPGILHGLDIDIKPGKLNFLLTGDCGLKNQVFNFFSRRGKTTINVTVDGKEPESREFVYLFDTKNLPKDITAGALYRFLFGKRMETPMERWEILFSWASRYAGEDKIILMDEFLKERDIKKIKGDIQSKNLNVLYISDKYYLGIAISDEPLIYHLDDKSAYKPGKQS